MEEILVVDPMEKVLGTNKVILEEQANLQVKGLLIFQMGLVKQTFESEAFPNYNDNMNENWITKIFWTWLILPK